MNSFFLDRLVKLAPFAMVAFSMLFLVHGMHFVSYGHPGAPGVAKVHPISFGDPGGPGPPN